MHKPLYSTLLGAALLATTPMAYADALDGLEMDVIGAEERPDEAARRIELPDAARPNTGDDGNEIPGRDTAAEARERGAEFGQETAEEARERQGPPEGVGRPDDAGPPDNGSGNRPDDPGDGSRPDDPGGNQPEAPTGEQPELPDNERPDGVGGNAPDEAGNIDRSSGGGSP